jgi:hypothetical protein
MSYRFFLVLVLVLVLVLNELVLGLAKKRWDAGASSERSSSALRRTQNQSHDRQNQPKSLFRVDLSRPCWLALHQAGEAQVA